MFRKMAQMIQAHTERMLLDEVFATYRDVQDAAAEMAHVLPCPRCGKQTMKMHANYVFEHPAEKFEDSYKGPFHVAYGRDKKLAGELGEWLCFIIQDQQESICIAQPIDGVKILPGKNYTAESLEAAHNEKG